MSTPNHEDSDQPRPAGADAQASPADAGPPSFPDAPSTLGRPSAPPAGPPVEAVPVVVERPYLQAPAVDRPYLQPPVAPPPGYPPSGPGYPPEGYPAQGYPAQSYPDPGYPNQDYQNQDYQNQDYQNQGYPTQGWTAPAPPPPEDPSRWGRESLVGLAIAIVVAALGLALGLLWNKIAPGVPALRTADGAVLAQPEQEQIVAAEGWYIIITVLAGIAVAVLAWLLLRRYRGVPMLLGLTIGALVAGYLAFYLGHNIGLAHARDLAAHAPTGTAFTVPPNLRVQQHGLWHGFLPYLKGDLLGMALATVVTYLIMAGFSSWPGLRPPRVPPQPPTQAAAPAKTTY